jgi:uncharacterized SAM-binding protein YcdF (DUF218 family)
VAVHRRLRTWGLAATLASCVLVAVVPATRRAVLQAAGRALVAADEAARADAIVLAGEPAACALEVADLVHAGVASRVAVLAPVEDPGLAREFARRGVDYEDAARLSVRLLGGLGVEGVETIPDRVEGTEDQGRVLPRWCDRRHVRSVIVVTDQDHSRRLRRVLRRTMSGRTSVSVRGSRYSSFDPDHWWMTREGTRTGVIELQKLLLDLVRHPLS